MSAGLLINGSEKRIKSGVRLCCACMDDCFGMEIQYDICTAAC